MGIYKAAGNLTLENSIVANNFNSANTPLDVQGDFTAAGANLVRTHIGTLLGGSAPLTDDPALEDLRSYGGPTLTMPPLGGSPVINAAIAMAQSPSSDQRGGGYQRPRGAAPDLGAIESSLSSNADLIALTSSAGQLSPTFLPDITEYMIEVPYDLAEAAIRATRDRGNPTMEVRSNDGSFASLADGEISDTFALNPGSATSTIEVKLTAEDGVTTKSYTILIVRAPTDATLSGLTTDSGSLSPAFDPATFAYDTSVPNGTTEATVTPTTSDPDATISITGDFGTFDYSVASGATSPALPLQVGCNKVTIQVTSRDGSVQQHYTLSITRQAAPEADADLSALNPSVGSLSPAFVPGVGYYTTSVDEDVNSVSVTPVAAQAGATIQVRINDGSFSNVASGATSAPLSLNPGANTVEVKVTAANGSTVKSYTLIVSQIVKTLTWVTKPATHSALSSDGRYVAFSSSADDVIDGDTNNEEDVFVYDRTTGNIERVSVSNEGIAGNGVSTEPAISADGRYVAFRSEADNLVPNDSNGDVSESAGRDVFVYDRESDTIERVSLTESGGQANQASGSPTISGDGRYVAFVSSANNLVDGFETASGANIYVHDRVEDTIVGIVVPFDLLANRSAINPVFSTDGRYVAFEFSVSKSIENGNDDYQYRDIYLYNRETLTVQRVTGGLVGKNADNTDSRNASISADGRYVAFESNLASIDFFDQNKTNDVFVFDRMTGLIQRVSVNEAGEEGGVSQESVNPAISGDGRIVVFESQVTNLVPDDNNARNDIFQKDLKSGKVTRLSVNSAGEEGDDSSSLPSIAFDGQSVLFHSRADNLGSPDASGGLFVAATEGMHTPSRADLASLALSASGMNPCCHGGLTDYQIYVENDVAETRLKAVAIDPDATVEVTMNQALLASGGINAAGNTNADGNNGVTLDANGLSEPLLLSTGKNVITIKVTSADGTTTKTYTVTIQRAPSSNAKLVNLALIEDDFVSVTPGFVPDTTSYTASVAKGTESIRVIPTATDDTATITVNGTPVQSGATSDGISLSEGSNTITVLVTAEDGSTTMQYTVTVNRAANVAPVAAAQTVRVRRDTEQTVLLSGFDADDDALSYTLVSEPSSGIFSATLPTLVYMPNAGFSGDDSFSFKVNDGTVDSPAVTVRLSVSSNTEPLALADSATTEVGAEVTIDVLSNDLDADSDPLTIEVDQAPTNGTATVSENKIVYAPTAGFSGLDNFTYLASDGKGGSIVATVTVIVTDPANPNQQPSAVDDVATTESGLSVTIPVTQNDSDADGDTLSITIGTQPANGTVIINEVGDIVYTSRDDFSGTDSFTYRISDGKGGEATATVTITVTAGDSTPVMPDNPDNPDAGSVYLPVIN